MDKKNRSIFPTQEQHEKEKDGIKSYKRPISLDWQLLGKTPEERKEQLMLPGMGFSQELAEKKASEILGLNLSIPELRALHGIYVLLKLRGYWGEKEVSKTVFDYSDNPNGEIIEKLYPEVENVPIISFELPEFYRACGLHPNKQNKFQGKKVMDLKDALFEGLKKPRDIVIPVPYWDEEAKKKNKAKFVAFQDEIKLCKIIRDYGAFEDLDPETREKLENGETVHSKVRKYYLMLHPILLKGLDKDEYFSLVPVTLYEDVHKVLPNYRGKAIYLFLHWLLMSKNKVYDHISIKKLAYIVRKGYLLNPPPGSGPQISRLKREIGQCCRVAYELNYLLDYQEVYQGNSLYLKLNPEICKRKNTGKKG